MSQVGPKKPDNLYLTGFMGSGKSTVAKALAQKLSWSLIDTDQQIEKAAGKSVRRIFDTLGEEAFRKLETNVLENVARQTEQVIALGGGAIMRDENVGLIQHSGALVFLQIDAQTALARTLGEDRPLLSNAKTDVERLTRIQSLMQQRDSRYLRADFKVDATLEVGEICEKIISHWGLLG